MSRLALALLLAAALRGCVAYEYEHEFWVRVDGSGTVNITGRPALWTAFKGLGRPEDPEATATRESVRALFEGSGLRVRRVTLTRRRGQPYLFISADFRDVNQLSGTAAFPDLQIAMRPEGDHLRLQGTWRRAGAPADPASPHREGLTAIRFHLPSKVYGHHHAFGGVERGNIVGWRETVAEGLAGRPLEFGAEIDRRSILLSTVTLFAVSIAVALVLFVAALWWVTRKGRGVEGGGKAAASR